MNVLPSIRKLGFRQRTVEKEKMDCLFWPSMSPVVSTIERLGRAEICYCVKDSCKLEISESIAVKEWLKLQTRQFKETPNGS